MGGVHLDDTSAHVVIHHADTFPVKKTACGTMGPSASTWRYVDCRRCMARAPDTAEVAARRRQLAGSGAEPGA